jgi:nucleoside-diphosphate-sugar epimerase
VNGKQRHLFCIGLGFSALTLARRLMAQGWTVSGTCRSAEAAAALAAQGIPAVIASREVPPADAAHDLASASHILVSVPPDDMGDPAFDFYAAAIARRPDLAWLGYLSTTGVYGDRQGGWVDEAAELRPSGTRGQRRVAAEMRWQDLGQSTGIPTHIFRLAGIYGPGRSALDTVRSGRAQRIVKPGQVFSRIHVEDIAAVLEASIARPEPLGIYNVCDDDPAPPDAVIAYACELLGVEPPVPVPFETAQLSAMARSFYDDNKRVSNARIKEYLGVTLAYPSYRDGLAALMKGSTR